MRNVLRLLFAACLLFGAAARASSTTENGVFRFLTLTLPVGSTNAEYVARVLTANADGPVVFSFDPSFPPPAGISMDAATGFLTGRPTNTFHDDVKIRADDGTQQIVLTVDFRVNASGGGGNAGSTFGNLPFAQGHVGAAYSHAVTVQNGVGPYVFGAAGLPPGLKLDGLTGAVTGTPTAAGTFYVDFSVTDHGEGENKVVTVAPLSVLPSASDFAFATSVLNNGEVGTPYCDTWLVQRTTPGPVGAATFSGSGLPAGLSVDPATGVVSGTPTVAGSFEVVLRASDGTESIATNLVMIVAPSPSSAFHWELSGVPTALANVAYARQPPILVAASGGASVTYAAVGLPEGITYSPTTGELAGAASEVGEFPTTFTASEAGGATLTFSLDFLVLPPSGGDAGGLAVNAWIMKAKLSTGVAGSGRWSGSCLYNADRRTGRAFDPATQSLSLQLGSSEFRVDAGGFGGTAASRTFVSPRGATPALAVKLAAPKQTLSWSIKSATFTEVLPADLRETILLGARGYRVDAAFPATGKLAVPAGLRRAHFVVSKAALSDTGGDGKDSLALSFLLADPAFTYEPGVSTLRLRVLSGATVLVDRDFTALGTGAQAAGAAPGSLGWKLGRLTDTTVLGRVAKFSFVGAKGKGSIVLAGLGVLAAPPPGEAHLGVELTVGSRIYFTSATFFERRPGRWSVP